MSQCIGSMLILSVVSAVQCIQKNLSLSFTDLNYIWIMDSRIIVVFINTHACGLQCLWIANLIMV